MSAAVLAVGGALAPAREDRNPSRTEERANPLIEEQVAAVAGPVAVAPFAGVQDAARLPRAHVLEILPAPDAARASDAATDQPSPLEGAGVLVSDGYLLSHATALDGRTSVRVAAPDGRTAEAVLAAFDPPTGLVLLKTTPGLATATVLASAPPEAGALTVAVGHAGGRPVAQPAFVTLARPARVVVSPAGPGTAPGLPVFTLAGALVGVMGAPGSGEVVPASAVVDRLIASATAGDMPRSFGLTVQDRDEGLARAFGDRGVLVADVVPDGPAALAGLEAGDLILRVGDDGVTSPEDVRNALAAASRAPVTALRVLQGRRERTVEVTPLTSYAADYLARLGAARDGATTAAAVLRPTVFTAAGLTPQTQVLSVNGVSVTSRAAADRALAAARPIDVLRVRDHRGARFVAMERAR